MAEPYIDGYTKFIEAREAEVFSAPGGTPEKPRSMQEIGQWVLVARRLLDMRRILDAMGSNPRAIHVESAATEMKARAFQEPEPSRYETVPDERVSPTRPPRRALPPPPPPIPSPRINPIPFPRPLRMHRCDPVPARRSKIEYPLPDPPAPCDPVQTRTLHPSDPGDSQPGGEPPREYPHRTPDEPKSEKILLRRTFVLRSKPKSFALGHGRPDRSPFGALEIPRSHTYRPPLFPERPG